MRRSPRDDRRPPRLWVGHSLSPRSSYRLLTTVGNRYDYNRRAYNLSDEDPRMGPTDTPVLRRRHRFHLLRLRISVRQEEVIATPQYRKQFGAAIASQLDSPHIPATVDHWPYIRRPFDGGLCGAGVARATAAAGARRPSKPGPPLRARRRQRWASRKSEKSRIDYDGFGFVSVSMLAQRDNGRH